MKFSGHVESFINRLEAGEVELVEGVSIDVIRERWLPIIRQLEDGLIMAREELVFGGNWEVARARIDALLTGEDKGTYSDAARGFLEGRNLDTLIVDPPDALLKGKNDE